MVPIWGLWLDLVYNNFVLCSTVIAHEAVKWAPTSAVLLVAVVVVVASYEAEPESSVQFHLFCLSIQTPTNVFMVFFSRPSASSTSVQSDRIGAEEWE